MACPLPVICGVGHETDFTIADFCADLRAPTPTAAAELSATPQAELLAELAHACAQMQDLAQRQLDRQAQRLDHLQHRLGRPSDLLSQQQMQLLRCQQRMRQALQTQLQKGRHDVRSLQDRWLRAVHQIPVTAHERLARAALRLSLLDPKLVLQRGFAWLSDEKGAALTSVRQTHVGQTLRATLADGVVDLNVTQTSQN